MKAVGSEGQSGIRDEAKKMLARKDTNHDRTAFPFLSRLQSPLATFSPLERTVNNWNSKWFVRFLACGRFSKWNLPIKNHKEILNRRLRVFFLSWEKTFHSNSLIKFRFLSKDFINRWKFLCFSLFSFFNRWSAFDVESERMRESNRNEMNFGVIFAEGFAIFLERN